MKHISGRRKLVPFAGLTTGRYRQLRVTEGEPSLGFVTEKTLPLNEDYYQLVTYGEGDIAERYWQVAPAGIITGISIFRNNSIIGTGNSINKLNFLGVAITAIANDFSTISTITVAPPGNDTEILFKDAGDFATSSAFTFDDATDTFKVGVSGEILTSSPNLFSVGVGGTIITALNSGRVGFNSSAPKQAVDIIGNLRLSFGTIYDFRDRGGDNTNILTRVNAGGTDGIEWITRDSFRSGAAGTEGNIQFKGTDGLLDAIVDFTFDKTNKFVGIGSTAPRASLDIRSPKGSVLIGQLLRSTTSSKDNGLQFFDAVGPYSNIDSAVYTEGAGRFINLGINASQVGIRTTVRVGGILRIDTRLPSDPDVSLFPLFGNTNCFVIKAVSIGDTDAPDEYNALVTNLDTGNTYLSPEKGAVAIGTEVISQKLNIAGYGITDNGIRIGDMQLFAYGDTNNNFKGSPTFRNLNIDAKTTLRVIPNGNKTGQLEVFVNDYFADPTAWDNFRIIPTSTYIRFDTSSASSGTAKPISIETNVDETGTIRANPGQVYLKTDGKVGINTEDPQYTLDVNGDLEVSGKFIAGDSTSGLANYVLESTETSTKWSDLSGLTVGTSAKTNNVKTTGISSNNTYYPTFVIANNIPPVTGGEEYEGVYTTSKLEFNPTQGLTLGSSSDLDVGIGITIIGIGTTTRGTYDKARIKIGNEFWADSDTYTVLHGKKVRTEVWLEQNSEDSDGVDFVAYKSRGTPGNETPVQLGDNILRLTARAYRPGRTNQGKNITLSEWSGDVSQISFDIDEIGVTTAKCSITLKTDNKPTLHLKSDGKVGVGTTNPSDTLEVSGDLRVTGFFKDSGGDSGTPGYVLKATSSGTDWLDLGSVEVATANSLKNTRTFSISGDGTATAQDFNGTQNVILPLSLNTTGVNSNTYGTKTKVAKFSVNEKGLITSADEVDIDFAGGIVGSANSIKTIENTSGIGSHYLTFVDSNNTSGDYEALYTEDTIVYTPSDDTLKLSNATANSLSAGALWLSGGSGAIVLDNQGQKRISWNDGGGNLTIRSGSYYNSGGDKYANSGINIGGAAKITLNSDGIAGRMDFQIAGIGDTGAAVSYGSTLRLSSNSFVAISKLTDLGSSSNRWETIYANNIDVLGDITVVDRIIGIADTAEKLGIGSTATNNAVYYPSFVKNTGTRSNQYFYTDPGFKIRQYNTASQVELLVDGNLIAGNGNGSVGLTVDDGYGNANVTFNHRLGTPDQNGNAARISFNANDTSNSKLEFQVKDNVTSGTPVALTTIAYISPTVGVSTGGFFPEASDTYRLGSASHRWKDVYAQSFNGQFVGTADTAKQIQVQEITSGNDYFLTFVNSNNTSGVEEEFLYTNSNISFNIPDNKLNVNALGVTNAISGGSLTISGNTNLNGGTTNIGNAVADRVNFTAKVDSNIIPNGTKNIGGTGTNERWGTIYATALDIPSTATIAGIASAAKKLDPGAKIEFKDGDLNGTTSKNFTGESTVSFALNLKDIITPAPSGTYGSTTTVPVIEVDAKGRVTSIGTSSIAFGDPAATQIDQYSDIEIINNGTSNYQVNNELVIFTGTSGRYNLPTSPAEKTKITFRVGDGSGGGNGNLIDPGTKTINSEVGALYLDVPNSSFSLVYVNDTIQWIII